jgi:serine/threonine-protein kinase RsbW
MPQHSQPHKGAKVTSAAARAATGYTGVFCGRTDQVSRARREVARHLAGQPAADDAALIVSELAANAVLHSASGGQFFTVRAELGDTWCRLEVEDLGGPWNPSSPDPSRPHGLDLVRALTGPGNWGIDGDARGHLVWARLTW